MARVGAMKCGHPPRITPNIEGWLNIHAQFCEQLKTQLHFTLG